MFSCTHKGVKDDAVLRKNLLLADSLFSTGKIDSGEIVLKSTRPKLTINSPLIINYYCQQSQHFVYQPEIMNRYADSAISFFSTESRINNHPDEYYLALFTKGNAALQMHKYIDALDYYYQSEKVKLKTGCANGEIADKIGYIYFGQKNYHMAARFWAKSYHMLDTCHTVTKQKFFSMQQGLLNNTGYAYQKAGLKDSALFYYLKDMATIKAASKNSRLDSLSLQSAYKAVYDNLGGLYFENNELKKADFYLVNCLKLGAKDNDSNLTALVKLAALYTKTGNDKGADSAFAASRMLLEKYSRNNRESEVKWNRLYSQYLFQKGKLAEAYRYQDNYIASKDSLESDFKQLYSFNVDNELSVMQKKQDLALFIQKNKEKKIYITGSIIIIALALAIILMIYQVLNRTKDNQAQITGQNRQLQQALDELELVNQNYIRIMRVMAHDLRNPLAGINGLANEMMTDESCSPDFLQMLKLIESTSSHSLDMINELLKNGLSNKDEVLITEKTDITALLYDSAELLQFKANEKQQSIKMVTSNIPLYADVSYEKIWRVINNLIINAIKFSHAAKNIEIGIKKENNKVLIFVADQGIGIKDEQKASVFEMFTPAKKAGTDGEQAFGLGLSISKEIVSRHNGRIWFESTAGIGTTFYVELPASE